MTFLVVGNGAREHALAYGLRRSASAPTVWCLPGNAGTTDVAHTAAGSATASDVIAAARAAAADIVVVGPEEPLANGLVDELQSAGIAAFGPHARAARLEASKAFAKQFMVRHGIPCADSVTVTCVADLRRELARRQGPVVVKKSGLAAGKGVLETADYALAERFAARHLADDVVVLEQFLRGYEVSVFALFDGRHHVLLPACADYKKAGEGDTGANTGGMGAVCPVPWLPVSALAAIEQEIVEPTCRGILADALAFRGVIFFGVMVTAAGPRLLEYNMRFGDPETQVLVPNTAADWAELVTATVTGELMSVAPARRIAARGNAVGVVMAAAGYPGDYQRGLPIDLGEAKAHDAESLVFHASTVLPASASGSATAAPRGMNAAEPARVVATNGGRCLTAVGLGPNHDSARRAAYHRVATIDFPGGWYRRDIGDKR